MGLATTAFNIGVGALGAAEFGTKGLIAGTAIGIGTEAVSRAATKDEEDSVKKAAEAGFISGVSQSAFSSMQELYAFHNPNSVQAISSLNTTTSISSSFDTIKTMLDKDVWKKSYEQTSVGLEMLNEMRGKGKPNKLQTLSATVGTMSTKAGLTQFRPENFVVDVARAASIKNQSMGEDLAGVLDTMTKKARRCCFRI